MADHQNPLRLFQRNMSTAVADSKLIEKLKNSNNGNEKDHHQHTIFHLAGGFINSFAGAQSKVVTTCMQPTNFCMVKIHSFRGGLDWPIINTSLQVFVFIAESKCL